MRMPGREINKPNYPPCNRAFALRMMNPTSYVDDHMSPLDKEIQPVYKKFVAKSADNHHQSRRTSDYVSVDEISLSPASSVASLSEMELYDIDENNYGMVRQHSSLDAYSTRNAKSVNKSSSSSNDGENGMVRSYTSVDGFNGYFQRGTSNRSTMPSRMRSKSSAKESGKANGYREEASVYLDSHKTNNSPKGNRQGSSLRRSQSLKGGRTNGALDSPTMRTKIVSSQKSPATKIRVAATKSSQLRAQTTETKQKHQYKVEVQEHQKILSHASPHSSPLTKHTTSKKGHTPPSASHKSRSLNNTEEYISESDSSSTVFSELDAYNPRCNPRGTKHVMKINNGGHHRHQSSPVKQPSGRRVPPVKDIPLQYSQPSVVSPKLNMNNQYSSMSGSYQLPKSDTFSNKLAEVCRLISEQHPGDFQILETLTEMQSAYEDRNELVKNTISGLRDKVRTLEYKCANSPNIPGLVIPLMRATNAFQTQLQSIMDAYHVPGSDKSAQFPEATTTNIQQQQKRLDKISSETNQVASNIEKLSGLGTTMNGHISSSKLDRQNESLPKKETTLESSTSSDKENIGNREQQQEPSTLESYAIITETPPVNV